MYKILSSFNFVKEKGLVPGLKHHSKVKREIEVALSRTFYGIRYLKFKIIALCLDNCSVQLDTAISINVSDQSFNPTPQDRMVV